MISDSQKADGKHALVVGGTGMLRRVPLYLAEHGYTISVIGRQMTRLKSLVEAASTSPGAIVPVSLDYHNDGQLRAALEECIERHGPVRLAVCWIHSTAPNALRVVGETLASSANSCRLFHVRGSASANPARSTSHRPTWLQGHPEIQYRQVILGFVVKDGKSRWLTHAEISDGVIAAIVEDAAYHIVGTVEPWSMRP